MSTGINIQALLTSSAALVPPRVTSNTCDCERDGHCRARLACRGVDIGGIDTDICKADLVEGDDS